MSWVITPQLKTLDGVISNAVAWWDASHADSFTFSSGTIVQNWHSRIGSYTLTQAIEANRPTRSGTVNGMPTVVFNGTSNSLSVANFDMTPGGQRWSTWAVFSAATGGTQLIAEHTENANNNPGAFAIARANDNKIEIIKKGSGVAGGIYNIFVTSATVTTIPKCVIGLHNGTLSTNESSGRVNGSSSGTYPLNNNTDSNNLSSTLFVGARGGSSLYVNGQICELGFTTAELNTTEIAALETYLSAKWGLGF